MDAAGSGQPGSASFPQQSSVPSGVAPLGMHRQACSKGHRSSQAPWQLPLSLPVPWVLSLTLTFNRNKHLEDKLFVVVCFFCACSFCLFQNLPCLGTGECFRCCAAGAMLALGLLPSAWAVSHVPPASPPPPAPASPSSARLLLSVPQERLQGEEVRDAGTGAGRLRPGRWEGCCWRGVAQGELPKMK